MIVVDGGLLNVDYQLFPNLIRKKTIPITTEEKRSITFHTCGEKGCKQTAGTS